MGANKNDSTSVSNANSGLEKKYSTSFVGALFTVLGSLFGIKRNNDLTGKIGQGNSTDNQKGKGRRKGLFENVRNFFKDIFGKNAGFKGKDHTVLDSSLEDSEDGNGAKNKDKDKNNVNGGLFGISKQKNGKDRDNNNNSKNNNASGESYNSFDKKYTSKYEALRRYKIILRSLVIVGFPGLIALAIAKIISSLWLLILLLLLLLLIATVYTMFKDKSEEELEKDEQSSKEIKEEVKKE